MYNKIMNTKDETEKTCKNCYYFYKNKIDYCEDCRYYGVDNYFKPVRKQNDDQYPILPQ
jgi:hypothetical protein